jgi:hypothetical protein
MNKKVAIPVWALCALKYNETDKIDKEDRKLIEEWQAKYEYESLCNENKLDSTIMESNSITKERDICVMANVKLKGKKTVLSYTKLPPKDQWYELWIPEEFLGAMEYGIKEWYNDIYYVSDFYIKLL